MGILNLEQLHVEQLRALVKAYVGVCSTNVWLRCGFRDSIYSCVHTMLEGHSPHK